MIAINKTRIIKSKLITIISLLCMGTAVLLSSCSNNIVYHRFINVKNEKWQKNDSLLFNIENLLEKDKNDSYLLFIEARHANMYKYRNISMKIYLHNDSICVDSMKTSIMLVNGRENWIGQGIGDYYVVEKKVKEIKNTNIKKIIVTQNMEKEYVDNIYDIGIKIVAAN